MTAETSDLYYAGFLLAKGYPLDAVSWGSRGRCTWVFDITSAGVEEPQSLYLSFLKGERVPAKTYAVALVDLKRMAMNPNNA
jgi:hypothetical protein